LKKLLTASLIANIILLSFSLWQQVPPAAEAGGSDGACVDDHTLYSIDGNADGAVDVTDALHLLSWLFIGGSKPLICLDSNGSAGGPSALPDTGQTTCYSQSGDVVDCASDTCAGQDGRYATGCSSDGRFIDNGDGTVTDNCTGLMWQKVTGNRERGLDWCSALDYCESLELAGHNDWRLPNLRELQSIVDYGRIGPSIDPVFDSAPFIYWSSTSLANGPGLAWDVSFSDGLVSWGSNVSFIHLVRAVRTEP